jgi:hypothetical protein
MLACACRHLPPHSKMMRCVARCKLGLNSMLLCIFVMCFSIAISHIKNSKPCTQRKCLAEMAEQPIEEEEPGSSSSHQSAHSPHRAWPSLRDSLTSDFRIALLLGKEHQACPWHVVARWQTLDDKQWLRMSCTARRSQPNLSIRHSASKPPHATGRRLDARSSCIPQEQCDSEFSGLGITWGSPGPVCRVRP